MAKHLKRRGPKPKKKMQQIIAEDLVRGIEKDEKRKKRRARPLTPIERQMLILAQMEHPELPSEVRDAFQEMMRQSRTGDGTVDTFFDPRKRLAFLLDTLHPELSDRQKADICEVAPSTFSEWKKNKFFLGADWERCQLMLDSAKEAVTKSLIKEASEGSAKHQEIFFKLTGHWPTGTGGPPEPTGGELANKSDAELEDLATMEVPGVDLDD